MKHSVCRMIAAATLMIAATCPSLAADNKTTIKVGLFDMSTAMPSNAPAYGMMGQGWGQGMMGQGWGPGQGMMGYGMMGGMMSIRIDHAAVKAGTVTFDVTNWSRGMLHEMLIVAVDNPNAPLPYDYSQAKVPEDQVKVLAEASDLQPNVSKSVDVVLTPGSYLLICNLPGHYASGMVTPLNVTP